MKHVEIKLGDIQIRTRHRKVLGDVAGLAQSIDAISLLHPIVVASDGTLIVGRRRVAAYEKLGRDTIPATVVDGLDELDAALQADRRLTGVVATQRKLRRDRRIGSGSDYFNGPITARKV